MMNLKLNPLTPGYGIRWNIEFDSLRKLVAAQKVSLVDSHSMQPLNIILIWTLSFQVVNKLLKDDLDKIKSRRRTKATVKKPRGYFHEIFFTPDDWESLEQLADELSVSFLFYFAFSRTVKVS